MAQTPLATLSVLVLLALFSACRDGVEVRSYVELLGTDTTAIEVLHVTPGLIEGELLVRSPATRIIHFVADLGEDGRIIRLQLDRRTPSQNPDGPPPDTTIVTMGPDSATVIARIDGREDSSRVGVTGRTIPGVPRVPFTVFNFQQAILQAFDESQERWDFQLLLPGNASLWENRIVLHGGDSVSMDFFGSPIIGHIGPRGRLEAITARKTTMKLETHRVGSVDLGRLAAEFAARDAKGVGLGAISPQKEIRLTTAGATLGIVYSRPAIRGREIWGGLVPWNEVWRTGANAATHLTTDRDLLIRDAVLPAGTYTLWSVFTPDSATLIVNGRVQIWGTDYQAEADVLRVPLKAEPLAEPVERFTIELIPEGDAAVIALAWDRQRFTVPVRVR